MINLVLLAPLLYNSNIKTFQSKYNSQINVYIVVENPISVTVNLFSIIQSGLFNGCIINLNFNLKELLESVRCQPIALQYLQASTLIRESLYRKQNAVSTAKSLRDPQSIKSIYHTQNQYRRVITFGASVLARLYWLYYNTYQPTPTSRIRFLQQSLNVGYRKWDSENR